MTGRIVVIGADAAGMSAASQAKRIAGDAVQIVAFERGTYSSYSACGIPYWVAGDVGELEHLIARSPEEHRRRGIDLHMRTEVEEIDLGAGVDVTLTYIVKDRNTRWIDRLITLHGIDEDQRAKLAEIAEKTPVTRAVRAGTEIRTTARAA